MNPGKSVPLLQEESDKDNNRNNNSGMELFDEHNAESNIKASEKSSVFHCNIFPIQFQSINNGETQGYSVRLELITEENMDKNLEQNLTTIVRNKNKDKIKKTVKMSDF